MRHAQERQARHPEALCQNRVGVGHQVRVREAGQAIGAHNLKIFNKLKLVISYTLLIALWNRYLLPFVMVIFSI